MDRTCWSKLLKTYKTHWLIVSECLLFCAPKKDPNFRISLVWKLVVIQGGYLLAWLLLCSTQLLSHGLLWYLHQEGPVNTLLELGPLSTGYFLCFLTGTRCFLCIFHFGSFWYICVRSKNGKRMLYYKMLSTHRQHVLPALFRAQGSPDFNEPRSVTSKIIWPLGLQGRGLQHKLFFLLFVFSVWFTSAYVCSIQQITNQTRSLGSKPVKQLLFWHSFPGHEISSII